VINIFVTQNTSAGSAQRRQVIHTLDVIARLDEIYALVFESSRRSAASFLSDADFLSMYATTAAAAGNASTS
jgi:hypothetical protein